MIKHLYVKYLDKEPIEVVRALGIYYDWVEAGSEQYIFWNCRYVPDKLPENFTVHKSNPLDCVSDTMTLERATNLVINHVYK